MWGASGRVAVVARTRDRELHMNTGMRLRRTLAATAGAVLAAGVGILAAPTASAAGATLHVDAGQGADSATCGSADEPCASIQQAIDNAAAGDTVDVAAGDYAMTQKLSITKPLTLQGPQAGQDPTAAGSSRVSGDTAGEAVLSFTGPGADGDYVGISLGSGANADSAVVIDGFMLDSATVYRGCSYPEPGTLTVRDNVIDGATKSPAGGLSRALWASCGDVHVQDNLITDTDGYTDSSGAYLATPGTVTFTGNDVSGWDYTGAIIVYAHDVNVSKNTFTDIGKSALDLAQITGTGNTVEDNTIINANAEGGSDDDGSVKYGALRFDKICTSELNAENCTDDVPVSIRVTGNTLDTAAYGVVTDVESGTDHGSYTIDFNDNSITGITGKALLNQGPAVIDATRNWWGTADGVDALIGGPDVTFEPYFIDAEMTRLSDGTIVGPDDGDGSLGSAGSACILQSLAGSLGSLGSAAPGGGDC